MDTVYSSRAVILPEIVAPILSHNIEKARLFTCLRVNRLWAEETIPNPWESIYYLDCLSTIKDLERRRFCAKHVQAFTFERADIITAVY